MGIVHAQAQVCGTRPLLWNHFGPESIPLEVKQKTGKAGNNPAEWKASVLATENGQLFLEPAAIFGCLRGGAKFTSRKRGTLQPIVVATLQVCDNRILIDRWVPAKLERLTPTEDMPVYLDVRTVRNPATGGRNVRYRVAAAPGWQATFRIAWDNTLLSEEEMEAVVRDSGRFVGLGDGRAIGLGRFDVVQFSMGEGQNAEKQTTKRGVVRDSKKNLAAGRA
ncbi:MAG: hypothetical protein U0Q18_04045 [Bryobacteraceae bacterium]